MLLAERYEIGDKIGSGGMGDVFRGLDSRTGEPVAIKALKDSLLNKNHAVISRFQREAETLRQLEHPNIVKILDAFEHDGQHFIVMEYLPGGSLRDQLKAHGPLVVEKVLAISLELADALTRSHHLNVIHRDIKPENVLLADDGTPRLSDFGVAQMTHASRLTSGEAIVGTFHYLSPEALNGQPLDSRTDIWAFGVMLYELLTGIRPFRGERVDQLMKAILMDYPDPDLEVLRPDIPVALVDLIYRMLDKNVQSRIPTMRVIAAEIEAISQGRTLYFMESRVSDHDLLSETIEPADISQFLKPPQHNLPANLNEFVGRKVEIDTLTDALQDQRLVSVVAAGGMGKTRLALELGWQQIENWQHGVFFVDLAPLTDPDDILATIAQAIGYQFHDDAAPHEQLLHYLRNKQMLLITDNFEHLLDGATLVDEILAAAPEVVILATSRERLALPLETIFTISGMDFPDWETPEDALQYSAAQLFIQSARRVNPTFELTPDELKYLVRICRLVDGMPLGIILAASWVDILTQPEITEEISRSADFLESDSRGMPDRHRSIRAVFDSSWQRLTEKEQKAFAKLSIFRGGFTREAAQTITGTDLRTLTRLVHKSLLQRSNDGRFAIHELMRQYAEEALESMPDHDTLYDAHSAYYLEFLRVRERDFTNDRHAETLYETQLEYNNIHVAWQWALENRANQRLIDCLRAMENYHDMNNSIVQFKSLIDEAVDEYEAESKAIEDQIARAVFSIMHIFCTENIDERKKRLRLSGDLRQEVIIPQYFEWRLTYVRSVENEEHFVEALSLAKQMDDDNCIGRTYSRWANTLIYLGEFERVANYLQKAEVCFRGINDYWGLARTYDNLGFYHSAVGNWDESKRFRLKALSVALKLDHKLSAGSAMHAVGVVERVLGNWQIAEEYFMEAIRLFEDIAAKYKQWMVIDELIIQYYATEDYELALDYAQQCMTMSREHGWLYAELVTYNQLGFIELALNNRDAAYSMFKTAITGDYKVRDSHEVYVNTVAGIASLFAHEGNLDRAHQLAYFVQTAQAPNKNFVAIERLVADLEAQLSEDETERLRTEAEQLNLVEVVRELRAEFGNQGDG